MDREANSQNTLSFLVFRGFQLIEKFSIGM